MKEQIGISWNEQVYNIFQDVAKNWHSVCLVSVLLAIVADLFLTFTYVPMYRTEVTVVRKLATATATEGNEEEEIVEALGYILSSNLFLDQVKKELEVKELQGAYEIKNVPGTNMMKIVAEATSPLVSYRMLASMMERYEEVVSLVIGDTKLEVIDHMQASLRPYNELSHTKNFLIFGGIGAMTEVFFTALLSFLKDTIKEKKNIRNKLQVRLLGTIQKEPKMTFKGGRIYKKKALLITKLTTSYEYVEAFHRLRHHFEDQAQKKEYRVVSISSTVENEGKSSTIMNLAIALAKQERKVLLIDMDLGKPALHKLLEEKVEHGIEEALQGKLSIDQTIHHYKRFGMDCIFVKNAVGKRWELLENPVLKEWISEKRKNYDYILVDTPPTYYMSDSKIVSQYMDAVLLVVRQNMAPTKLINRTIDHYISQDTPIMGCVLNCSVPDRILGIKSHREREGAEYADAGN